MFGMRQKMKRSSYNASKKPQVRYQFLKMAGRVLCCLRAIRILAKTGICPGFFVIPDLYALYAMRRKNSVVRKSKIHGTRHTKSISLLLEFRGQYTYFTFGYSLNKCICSRKERIDGQKATGRSTRFSPPCYTTR